MSAGDSLRRMFDHIRSGDPARPRKPGTIDRFTVMPLGPLSIPPQTEMVLESPPTSWPFQCKYVVFPKKISLGTNNDSRLTWRHPDFLGGEAPAYFFNEATAELIQPNPLRGKWIEVGEKICIKIYNETLAGEPLEVRGSVFGIIEVPEKPFAFPSIEERRQLIERLTRGDE